MLVTTAQTSQSIENIISLNLLKSDEQHLLMALRINQLHKEKLKAQL